MTSMSDTGSDAASSTELTSDLLSSSVDLSPTNDLPKPPIRPFRLGNQPALTGIRAPLLAAVVIYHFSNFAGPQGAWVALGAFFTLSGFLITSMLVGERQRTDRISLGNFYSRRAVRLLPPLLLTVALLGIYALFVYVQNAGTRLWEDAASAVFYYQDYSAAYLHEPNLAFLSQCWSLSIEEQFYLIWAALLVGVLKFGSRRAAYAVATFGVLACTVNRMWLVLSAPHWSLALASRTYYSFDTRADALFVGCLLGLIATGGHLSGWKPWANRTLATLALAATAIMVWITFSVNVVARSLPLVWLPVSDVASVVIIAYLVVQPKGWGARALGVSALVLVGNMSYTIYLIHWPIYMAINPLTVGWSDWTIQVVRTVLVAVLAAASWYLMERPLMRWRRRSLEPPGTVDPADAGGDGAAPGT
jgi:peptidoglycan/LPS O-acetylase OafA/YrhL